MSPALTMFITTVLRLLPSIVQAGMDIAPFVETLIHSILTGADPTAEEWFNLRKTEEALRTALQAPV